MKKVELGCAMRSQSQHFAREWGWTKLTARKTPFPPHYSTRLLPNY